MFLSIRRSMVAAFWAFVLFSFACVALGRTSDPSAPFDAVGRAHSEIGFAYALIVRSFDIAVLAVVLGGLPFLFIALKRASGGGLRGLLRLFAIRPKRLFLLLGAALLLAICFLGYLLATEYFSGSSPLTVSHGSSPFLLVLALVALLLGSALGLFVIMAIAALLSVAILRTEFGTGMLRLALIPIALLALVMAASTLAAAFWTIRLWVAAPQFAASSSGLGDGQTAWVIAIIFAMALSAAVTIGAFWRGLRSSGIRAGYI